MSESNEVVEVAADYQVTSQELRLRIFKAMNSIKGLKYLQDLASRSEAFAEQETGKREQRSARWRN